MISETVKPEGKAYSSEVWHEYLKSRFIGCDEIQLPNGKTLQRPHSSAELDQAEFAEYADKVEAWASERGVHLEMET